MIEMNVTKKIFDMKKVGKSNSTVSIMYSGGTIRPLNGGNVDEIVEAIGFHDGKVLAAGTKGEVTAQMDKLNVDYAKIELSDGETLLPGLIEPHVHIVMTAMMVGGWNDFGPFDGQELRALYNPKWLDNKIAVAKESIKWYNKRFWILGYSVDPSLMPFTVIDDDLNELISLDCDTVDGFEADVPVLMMAASGHTAYVNSKAVNLTYKANPKLQEDYPTVGDYRKHVNDGGGLQEMVEILPAFTAIPKAQIAVTALSLVHGLRSMFELANQRGVTLMYDAAMTSQTKNILDAYFSLNFANVRIGYALICNSSHDAEELPSYEKLSDLKNLYQGSVKIVSDGSNQGLTGYQPEGTYRCKPEKNRGIFNFGDEEFNRMVKNIIDKKWPVMIHANGITAIGKTLTAYENALGSESGLLKRHRIEHCSLPDGEALKKMADLGISPNFLIGHVGYWGYAFDKGIFEENAQLLDPCRSALDNSMRISFHTDYFVSPLGPLRMMEQAITRIMEKDPDGRVLNEYEKLTPAQALRAVTYDAAWQCHADEWVGSLEKGKMADYIKLGEDPITRKNPVGMRNIPVLETWVGGVRVFANV